MKLILALWCGEKGLVFTFWFMTVMLTTPLTIMVLIAASTPPPESLRIGVPFLVVSTVYLMFIFVSVWRCYAAHKENGKLKYGQLRSIERLLVAVSLGITCLFITYFSQP
ncbi:MAG: hypothetical protein P8H03_06665 [Emcibacteraceae bacterium]|nr:hypothetical protein [Emcibacteraceae bacterium]MDG1995266.1 hypothetical protein [Emcibacteraceae bacterium]